MQHSAGTCPNSSRDGFARDCPLRHPVLLMLALRDRAGATPSFSGGFQAISAGAERGAEKGRRGWGEVAAGVLVIVSRAGFRGPGWALPGHLPSCERRISNWAAGTVQFCRPIPARGWAPVRIGIPVVPENPGISRIIF